MSFGFERSALGGYVRSPLGVRTREIEDPPVGGPALKDFIEFISEDNAGTWRGITRLHGDCTAPGVIAWPGLVGFDPDRINSVTGPAPSVGPYDPSATVTICNGTQIVATPIGSTLITVTSATAVAAPPEVLRIKAALAAPQSVAQEHWTNLQQCTQTVSARYYNVATPCIWGYLNIERSQQAANTQLTRCDGSLWQTALGDIENNWRFLDGGTTLPGDLYSSLLERWDGTDSEDFSALVLCPAFPDTRFADFGSGVSLKWNYYDRGGTAHNVPSPDVEWIGIPVAPFVWPAAF